MDNPPSGITTATYRHVEALAAAMCREHAREARDTADVSPPAALRLSLAGSLEAYAMLADDGATPVFAMGVEQAGLLSGSAMVWMLGTDAMKRRPAALLRAARWGVNRAFAVTGADRLEQYIPEWYGAGLRFALRLGFGAGPANLRCGNGVRLRHVVLARAAARSDNRKGQPWEYSTPHSPRPAYP